MIRALSRKLLRDLLALKAQTLTTAVLVVCGVSLLVSAWSAFNSLRDARDRYYREYAFGDLFAEFKRAPLDLARRIARIPGVDTIDARIVEDGLVSLPGREEPAVGRFISVPPGAQPALDRLYLRKGRLPVQSATPEVVVHEGFAHANGLKIGDRFSILVQGHRETARVVGIALSPEYVYALSPAAPLPDDRHFGVFWMVRTDLERLALMPSAFNSVVLKLAPGASEGAAVAALDALLLPYGGLGAYARDRQQSNMFVNDELNQQRSMAIINPLIFLSVAAFLIHVISARLIALQRAQIATLKAIGYTSVEVSVHYVQLVTAMMLVGALPGIALGAWIGRLLARMYESYFRFPRLDFSLSAGAVAVGLAAGVIPGLVGAWSSIRSAFRMAPAEAMRPLAPPAFHSTLLEKAGLQRKLAVRQRMIWRNLLFRPMRLALTVLGMSAALAVVVAAGSWNDVLSFVLGTQFQRAQREDVSLSFVRPLPSSALQELRGLKGVLAVEGYRSVPVRLRHLNHRRELTLTGWPADASMRQRLDLGLRTIALPSHGLLLSRFFETSWGLRAGDTLEVEPLEGQGKILRIPIAGFTDELLGMGAAMEIHELWNALGEQPAYNVATLKADPAEVGLLYVKLKELPEIATVSLKQALYRGFQETIAAIIRTSSAILAAFALAIAVGVIYNSVRVSFSERSWEMASLRVIGFSSSQVFAMLLGEVATQVALSLLPGCLLGLGLARLVLRFIHTETFRLPLVLEASSYAEAVLVVLAAFGASALAVRGMVSKLSLAEALKARE